MTVDPNRCPGCGAPLTGTGTCAECGMLLRGPLAQRLWQVDVEIDRLTETRRALVKALRPGGVGAASTAATATGPDAEPPAPAWLPPRDAWEPRAPKPRKEWTPQRVQNLLLTTGALLLVAAAIAFTAFAWGRLPIAARGGIMLAVTGVAGWSATWVHRRGLTASAEAIALIAVLFGAVDAYAARRAGLANLDATDALTYWSVASGVLAALSAGFGRVLPVRSVRYAALAGAQLPLLLTAVRLEVVTPAERAVFLTIQAALLGLAAYRLGETALAARVSGALNWSVATLFALGTAFAAVDKHDVHFAALVLVATGAVALLWPGAKAVTTGVVTGFALTAVTAVAADALTFVQLPAAIAAAGLLAIVAGATAPREWRAGPVASGAGSVAVALAFVVPWVGQAVLLPFSWVAEPWRIANDLPARDVLGIDGARWGGSVVALGVVTVAAVAAVVVAEAVDRRREARVPVIGLLSVATLLVPLGFASSYRVALAWYVATGVAGLATAYVTKHAAPAALATVVLTVATAWSLANEAATLAVLAAVTVAYAAYASLEETLREAAAGIAAASAAGFAVAFAASRGAPVERIGFVLATATFVLMAAAALFRVRSVEGVAAFGYVVAILLSFDGTGWLAATLGGGAAVAAASAVRPQRRSLAAVAALLAVAAAGTTAYATGMPLDRSAFWAAVVACAAVGAGYLLRDEAGDLVEMAAGLGYAAALVLTLPDLGWLSWVLALGGLTALANALRPERHALRWVATVLLTAWSWDRLFLADVDTPEAYAAPVALLTLALGHLRRRRDPSTTSWQAYGRGLGIAFGPTTVLLFTDHGVTRPVLLAVAAVVVLLAGLSERLQAPLTVGAVALAIDALVQLAPVMAALPRWVTIGSAGLLVIAVGVTYEQRRRDMTRLRETYDSLA